MAVAFFGETAFGAGPYIPVNQNSGLIFWSGVDRLPIHRGIPTQLVGTNPRLRDEAGDAQRR